MESGFKNEFDLSVAPSGAGGEANEDSQNQDLYGVNGTEVDGDAAGASNGGANGSEDEELPHLLREQDRYLPIANVAKLMKKAIPDRGKIAKEAKECVQEAVSEFISFITSEAAERCALEKRKTINGEDIIFALDTLGFENYVEPLKVYLLKYRDTLKCDTNAKSASNEYSSDLHVENLGNYN
jgi:nuclear transcription Y subunit beta